MAIRLTTTKESIKYIKCLVYGDSGFGKTWLCQTAPKPVIISAEKGLLTLRDVNIPVIEISSYADFEDAYTFVTTNKKAEKFQTICLDSISDIAETILSEEKENCGADPRKAYMAYQDKLLPMIKKFRDIDNRHVYFTAKMRRVVDEFSGITSFGPSMPGQQLGPNMPYLFDFVLAIRIGQDEDGEKFRYLQTASDVQYIAKARGGRLDFTEPPDLSYIFEKSLNGAAIEQKFEKPKKKVAKTIEKESNESSEDEVIEIEGDFEESEQVEVEQKKLPDDFPDSADDMDKAAESSFIGDDEDEDGDE